MLGNWTLDICIEIKANAERKLSNLLFVIDTVAMGRKRTLSLPPLSEKFSQSHLAVWFLNSPRGVEEMQSCLGASASQAE